MGCSKIKNTPPPCQPPCPKPTDGCGCILAASKSAESAAASANAAAKSAELAQKLLKGSLTDVTIEPGGGLKPSGDGHGITIDEAVIAEKLAADATSLNKLVTAIIGNSTAMQAIADALADTDRAITVVNNKLGVNIDDSTLGLS